MALIFAIILLLAAVSHQSHAGILQDWERDVCAAYFKVSGLDKSSFPAGQVWEDKVCVSDPAFFLNCKYSNGVFTGEKCQCPPGKMFYHGKHQFWEKTCIPASKCDSNKPCPNWLQIATPTPVLTECERQRREGERMTAAGVLDVFCPKCDVNGQFKPMQCDNSGCWCVYADGTKILGIGNFALTEAKCALYRKGPIMKDLSPVDKDVAPVSGGTHGCIDCVIGECHRCLCEAALGSSGKDVAYVIDPNNKARNQYLVCEGNRITCHPCPKGLVFDCRRGVCATTGECPKIPAKCFSSCPVSTTGKWLGSKRDPTATTATTTTADLAPRHCACKMALKAADLSSAFACDPFVQQNYLICQDDGTYESKACPAGEAWNYEEKTCSDKMRKCRPLPANCSAM